MKKHIKKGMKNTTNDNSEDKYTYKGFTFKFEDKGLQQEYVKTYETYKELEFNLPTSNISHIDAVSISRGSERGKLELISEIYDSLDYSYNKGSKHKDTPFEKLRKRYNGFRKQLDNILKFYELVEDETRIFNKKYPKGKLSNGQTKRYNVVWYSKFDEGASIEV